MLGLNWFMFKKLMWMWWEIICRYLAFRDCSNIAIFLRFRYENTHFTPKNDNFFVEITLSEQNKRQMVLNMTFNMLRTILIGSKNAVSKIWAGWIFFNNSKHKQTHRIIEKSWKTFAGKKFTSKTMITLGKNSHLSNWIQQFRTRVSSTKSIIRLFFGGCLKLI